MKKYLHIIEYSKLGKIPKKESFEHEFKYLNSIFRVSVKKAENKEMVKESFNPYYNSSKLDEKIFELKDTIIFDDIDILDEQELAYIYECPICLYKIITSSNNIDFCPQCENTQFPFNLIALLNTEQMEELAIDNKDVTSLVILKDGKIQIFDRPKTEGENLNA